MCKKLELSQFISDIIIIDNSNSFAVDENLGEKVNVIIPHENLGFGKAVNLAVTKITNNYFLLLNPDMKFSIKMLDMFLK